MRYTVAVSVVQVIGRFWMGDIGGYQYEIGPGQLAQMKDGSGDLTRESVDKWVRSKSNTGDFESIIDWSASLEDGDSSFDFGWWLQEESEELWDEMNYSGD